jgi:hypothetical protein
MLVEDTTFSSCSTPTWVVASVHSTHNWVARFRDNIEGLKLAEAEADKLNNMLSVSGERGAEMITPISPAAPRNTEEQLVRLCYRLGRHLLNPDNIPWPTWGRIGQELLAELRDMDTAKYMEAMKPNVQDQPRLAKEKRHEENQEAVACQP